MNIHHTTSGELEGMAYPWGMAYFKRKLKEIKVLHPVGPIQVRNPTNYIFVPQ